jgi:hypothetical protein
MGCATALAGPLQCCGIFGPSYTSRFRLKISGSWRGTEVNGSSVIQADWTEAGPLSQQGLNWLAKYIGEAPCIDLGQGRALVALLGTITGYSEGFTATGGIFQEMFPDKSGKYDGAYWENLSHSSEEGDLPKKYWPLFAYFSNVKDIASANIMPVEELENTTAMSVERVRLQLTRDPVTEQLGTCVPWLEQVGKTSVPLTQSFESRRPFEKFEKRNFRATGGGI